MEPPDYLPGVSLEGAGVLPSEVAPTDTTDTGFTQSSTTGTGFPQLWTSAAARYAAGPAAKTRSRLALRLYPTSVLGNPRLSGGFRGERADLGRIGLRDTDLHGERPVPGRDHPISHLAVGMGSLPLWLSLSNEGPLSRQFLRDGRPRNRLFAWNGAKRQAS